LICGEDITDVASYGLFVVVSGFGGELSPGLSYADDRSSVVFDAVLVIWREIATSRVAASKRR
jgi:hypothetical protein